MSGSLHSESVTQHPSALMGVNSSGTVRAPPMGLGKDSIGPKQDSTHTPTTGTGFEEVLPVRSARALTDNMRWSRCPAFVMGDPSGLGL